MFNKFRFAYCISVVQRQEAHNLIDTILLMQPRMSGGSAGTAGNELVDDLATDILKKLDGFDLDMENADKSLLKLDSKKR